MPYNSVSELPDRIKSKYSPKAQRAFMHAFNSAWDGTCKDREDREGCAFAVGTAAAQKVEKSGMKVVEFLKGLIGLMEDDVEDTERATKTEGDWSRYVPITKLDTEKRIVYGPVLEPRTADDPDTDGDYYNTEEIERAAHRFMKKLADGDAGADGVEHIVRAGADKAHLVESWIAGEDTTHGDQAIRKGTWMVGIHLPDDELWQAAKDGVFTGFSIGGRGVRE